MTTFVEHWLQGNLFKNFGEHMIPHILSLFDVHDLPLTGEKCLYVIGSELTLNKVEPLYKKYKKVTVWGQGHSWGDPPPLGFLDVRAVRGPLTRDALGLPKNTPMGDPGFLIDKALSYLKPDTHGEPLYVPHYNLRKYSYTNHRRLNVSCTPKGFLYNCKQLLGAEFVFTSAMHVAIFCLVWRIPFAFLVPPGTTPERPLKFHDLFQWLELPFTWFHDENSARLWYDTIREYQIPDLTPLLESFPYDLFE